MDGVYAGLRLEGNANDFVIITICFDDQIRSKLKTGNKQILLRFRG